MPASQYGYANAMHGQRQYQYQAPDYDVNTTSWGVKYKQQHHDNTSAPAPPLPPRPSSANPSQVDLSARPPQSTTPLSAHGRPNNQETSRPTTQPSRQSWRESFYNQALAEDPVPGPPPPPPPRPIEYQAQPQQPSQYISSEWPYEQYSNKPASHHYDPSKLQQASPTPSTHGWGIPPTEDAGPVSPEERHHTRWESSSLGGSLPLQPLSAALDQGQNQPNPSYHEPSNTSSLQISQFHATVSQGHGAPSDWERFTPTDMSSAVLNLPPELSSSPTVDMQQGQFQLAQERSQKLVTSQSGLKNPPSNASQPHTDSSSTPDPGRIDGDKAGSLTNELSDESRRRLGNDRLSSRHGSTSLTDGAGAKQRSGTIDSIIDAWSGPLTQNSGPQAKEPTAQAHTDALSISLPSQTQSTERLTKTTDLTLHSIRRNSPKGVESIRDTDLYNEVNPEYRSSLTRFLKMLKEEDAAPSDQEKYTIFQSFVQKELRIRQALYGIEPDTPPSKSSPQIKKVQALPTVEEAHADEIGGDSTIPRNSSQVKRKAVRSGSVDSLKSSTMVPDPLHTTRDGSATHQSATPSKSSGSRELSAEPPKLNSTPQVQSNGLVSKVELSEKVQPSTKISKILTSTLPEPNPVAGSNQSTTGEKETRNNAKLEQLPPTEGERNSTALRVDPPKAVSNATTGSNGISNSDVNKGDDEVAYSPGGRPLLSSQISALKGNQQARDPLSTQNMLEEGNSPSNNAPMVIEDYELRDYNPPSTLASLGIEDSDKLSKTTTIASGRLLSGLSGPVKFEPPRPVYTPFRYNETPSKEASNVLLDRPADEAYSTLRNQAAGSGRFLSHEVTTSVPEGGSTISSPTSSRREHQETFLGLIRHQSKVIYKGPPGPSPAPAPLRVGTPLRAIVEHPVSDTVSALRNILPMSLPKDAHIHEKITSINSNVEAYPDDFGFIKETVLSWARVNKEVKKAQDEDRDKRQTESEAHIDELFNSHEISYADIHSIEEDFKLAEAELRYQEDQQELQSFIDSVYSPVHDRIQNEILQLMPSYTLAIDMLDLQSDACSRILNSKADRVQMAAAMDVVLHVFRKLEIRHKKLAEARFERERRRKTLELAVLNMNGNISAMKKLEQEFTAAEKLQVLEEAHEEDKRANNLMDTFDRATVRGLGDNQTCVDDVVSKIRKLREVVLKEGLTSGDGLQEADNVRQTLVSAQDTLDFILADSRTILTTSNAADSVLNEADYRVSVCKARAANADEMMFQKLQEDRAKEDAKIMEEMGVRLDSMAKGPAEATMLIQEIVSKIGDSPEHQDRIKRALEEAKRRNAAK